MNPRLDELLVQFRPRFGNIDDINLIQQIGQYRKLKETVTIVIVTHNMQQAARVSDYTAFLYLGELIEFGETSKIFTAPEKRQTEDYITGRFG